MLLPNLSGLAPAHPTGMQAAQDAVLTDPDLLALVLSAVNEGRPEEACKIAMNWCATHKVPACEDDTFWFQLMKLVFPHPASNRPPPAPLPLRDAQGNYGPRVPLTYKEWFYWLCMKLKAALRRVEATRARLEYFNDIRRKVENGESLTTDEEEDYVKMMDWGLPEQKAMDAWSEAELRLKVARWGRLRGDVGYWFVKGAKTIRPAMAPPDDNRGMKARVLTEDEMRKELDRMEAIDRKIRFLISRGGAQVGKGVMERRDDADYDRNDQVWRRRAASAVDGVDSDDDDDDDDEDTN